MNIFICADIDECFNNPCLNNASGCKNTFGSYQCKCAPGYTGIHCQIGKLNIITPTFYLYLPMDYGVIGPLLVQNVQ